MTGYVVGKDFIMKVKNKKEADQFITDIHYTRYSIAPYGNRFYAVYDYGNLVCVTYIKRVRER